MTKIIVGVPVSGRPHYFSQMLYSWAAVRGVSDVEFVFSLEPLQAVDKNTELIVQFLKDTHAKCHIILNNTIQGPAKNHYQALQAAYNLGAEHIVLAEEDIVVSDDTLEYQSWGHEQQRYSDIVLVCSYSNKTSGEISEVYQNDFFEHCWLWGTSRFWWETVVGKYWDSDFSTGEGFEKGWDWNLARVIKERNLTVIQPTVSRAQNIGEIGWSTGPGSLIYVPTFRRHQESTQFKLT